jgi:hypothetical protein
MHINSTMLASPVVVGVPALTWACSPSPEGAFARPPSRKRQALPHEYPAYQRSQRAALANTLSWDDISWRTSVAIFETLVPAAKQSRARRDALPG